MEPDSGKEGNPPSGEGVSIAYLNRVLVVIALLAVTALAAVIVWKLLNILMLAFGGIMAAVLFHYLGSLVSRWTHLPYQLGVVLVAVGIFGLIGGLIGVSGPLLSNQLTDITTTLPQYLERSQAQIEKWPFGEQIIAEINSFTGGQGLSLEMFSNLTGPLLGIFGTTLGTVVSLLLIFLTGIYLAIEPGIYVRGLLRLVPISCRPRAQEVLDRLYNSLVYWFFGQTVSLTLIGAGMTIGMIALGVPLPVFLGLLTAVLTIIPNLGPTLAAVPVLLLALSVSPWTALYALIFVIALQNLEGIFVTPTIMRRAVQLPPALLIVVQISLVTLAGFLGLLLATPLLVCIMVLVQMLYVQDVLGDTLSDKANVGKPVVPDKPETEAG